MMQSLTQTFSMKPMLVPMAIFLLALSACNRELKYDPAGGTHLRTDTSMVLHEEQANKSSTSVGIGLE
jgi:hypothetical protein